MIKPLFFYQHWRWEKSPKKCRMGMTQGPMDQWSYHLYCTHFFRPYFLVVISPYPVTIGLLYGYIWYLHLGINDIPGLPLDISEALGNIKTKSGWWLGKNPVLKNMSSSIGMMKATQYSWEHAKNGNQTTNQNHILQQ